MSDFMDRILADKAKTRRELADLPFDEKLVIMEKLRQRNALLAENPLRRQNPPTDQPPQVSEVDVVVLRLETLKCGPSECPSDPALASNRQSPPRPICGR